MARGIIFDLDGTLLDTLADLANSANRALEHFGHPAHPMQAYKQMIGNGVRNLLSNALPQGAGEAHLDEVLAWFKGWYASHSMDETAPYPGIDDMLAKLARRGVPMSILSNKHHDAVGEIVRQLLPGHSFICAYGERPGIPRKPHPAAAFEIAEAMGMEPRDMVYVGDSGGDMHTAVNAGMLPVGVLWGFRGRDELLECGAAHVIAEPSELLDIISYY